MERKQRYGLRKLSVGVVSCFLGSVIYFSAGMTVNAEEIQPDNMEETASSYALAETSSDSILDESAPQADEAPATTLAAPQEDAPAEDLTLNPQDAQENVIDEKGEVKWDGITEDDVNPGVDSRNGAVITKPELAMDYYHINGRQDISSLIVVDLRNTNNGGIAADSYTKYYGVDAYIVTSYMEGTDAMLVQVIKHGTHEILEEVEVPADGKYVILNTTRSFSKTNDKWVGVGNGTEENYIRVNNHGVTTQLDQLDSALDDPDIPGPANNSLIKVVYHASLPQADSMSSDQISSPIPNPMSDSTKTSYTVVDANKQYVLDENGNKLTLAEYTMVGYQGDDYHASEVRDINGFDLYKAEDDKKMTGKVRKGQFVDGQEDLISYFEHKDKMIDGREIVGTRVFINDGEDGDVFVELRWAYRYLYDESGNVVKDENGNKVPLALRSNFSDMSIWTTMFRSESLAPGQISQTGNADSLNNAGGFSLDIDGDGQGDYIKGAYFDDWHAMPGGVANGPSGQNHSVWWIRNNRTVTSDDAEHVYIPQGTVRVHYIDEKGKVIKQLVTAKGENVTKEFAVKEATEVNDGTKVSDVTYSLSKKGSSYNVDTTEYKPKTIVFEGKTYYLKEVKTPTGTTEQEDVNVKTASGETKFTYNRVDAPTSGTIDSATIYDITYVYMLKGDVVVHYVDEDGNTIKDDVQDTPLVPTGTNYDTTDNKPKVIKFNGKEYELVPKKTIGKENGKVVEGTTHITYVYKLKKGDVVVHYVDEDGNPIKEDVVDTPPSPTGTEYDTTDNKPTIITYNGKKYELVPIKTVGKENGKVVEGTTHITYVYRLVPEQPPVVTPPTSTPKPAPIPTPTPVQTGMGNAVASSMATMLTSLGAMVVMKKKEKE